MLQNLLLSPPPILLLLLPLYKFSFHFQIQHSLSVTTMAPASLHQTQFLFTLPSKTAGITPFFFNFPTYKNFSSTTNATSNLNSLSFSLFSSPPPYLHTTRVSTVPVEYAPPAPNFDFNKEISRLKALRSDLSNSIELRDKIRIIDRDSRVQSFFNVHKNKFFRALEFMNFDEYELFLLKCVVAAGQEHLFGSGWNSVDCESESESESESSSLKSALYALADMIENCDVSEGLGKKKVSEVRVGGEDVKALRSLVNNLGEIERFYNCIGGIIGFVFFLAIYFFLNIDLLANNNFRDALSNSDL